MARKSSTEAPAEEREKKVNIRKIGALKPVWGFLKPYRLRVVGAMLALAFTAGVTLSIGQGIRLLIDAVPDYLTDQGKHPNDSLSPVAPYRVVNIGNSDAIPLLDFIKAIEDATGVKAEMNMMPMQPGDGPATWADTTLLQDLTGVEMTTDVETGVKRFVEWYRRYYDL